MKVEMSEWQASELDAVASRYDQNAAEFLRRCSQYIIEEERRG